MNKRELKEGTKTYWGASAKPMPEIMADAISQVVAQVPGIVEAHLPQCFIEGDTEARQVLVVGVQNDSEIPHIAQQLVGKLQLVFAPGQFIDVMPFESGSVPPGVREAGCQIFSGQKKAWWKVWRCLTHPNTVRQIEVRLLGIKGWNFKCQLSFNL